MVFELVSITLIGHETIFVTKRLGPRITNLYYVTISSVNFIRLPSVLQSKGTKKSSPKISDLSLTSIRKVKEGRKDNYANR